MTNLSLRPSRRQILAGAGGAALLATAPAFGKPDLLAGKRPKQIWGPRVDTQGLPDLFAPQKVESRQVVDGGIDHLGLHSVDVFEIPRFGAGIFEVQFNGYFQVARANPTLPDGSVPLKSTGTPLPWNNFRVQVNIIDLRLHGEHPELGPIHVRLNQDIVSVGEIFAAKSGEEDAQCRIATAATFDVPNAGVKLFNKEPILLMNNHVVSIPPVNDPSGQALLYKLPLFAFDDPDGMPFGYLTSLKYGADHYLTPLQVKAIKEG